MNDYEWNGVLIGVGLGVTANILFALLLFCVQRVRSLSIRHVVVRLLRWSVRQDEALRAFLLSQLGGEIEEVYPNRAIAGSRLYEDNIDTRTLKIMTNRGAAFSERGSERDYPVSGWRRLAQTRVLLLNPNSQSAARRFSELKPLSAIVGWELGDFKTDILSAARKLSATPNVEVKFHKEPSVFRIVITDRYCYISGFSRSDYGRNMPVYKVRSDSAIYVLFEKYFEEAWQRGTSAIPEPERMLAPGSAAQ
ncbi:MAG TPA: hypothetical protein VF121_05165 [Thermoanaerobaculia bacterium]|nr:hypothetical protein [Thermoanaerobaculia bacterium]